MEIIYKSGISGMADVLRDYAFLKQEDLAEVMEDRAGKLMSSDFGNGVIGLYQAGAEISPQANEILSLPEKLRWRIKRKGRPIFTRTTQAVYQRGKKKGQTRTVIAKRKDGTQTREGEIERRIRARLYHASGWLNKKYGSIKGSVGRKDVVESSVSLELQGDVLALKIVNNTNASEEIVLAHGSYVQEVLEMQIRDMLDYIEKKTGQKIQVFNNITLPVK